MPTRGWRACLHSLCTQQLCIDHKHLIRIFGLPVSPQMPRALLPAYRSILVPRRVRASLEKNSGGVGGYGNKKWRCRGHRTWLRVRVHSALPTPLCLLCSLILWVGNSLGHFEIRHQCSNLSLNPEAGVSNSRPSARFWPSIHHFMALP